MNIEKYGVIVVDRAAVPVEGSVMLMATEKGFSLQRATKPGVPSQDLWGVVMWHIKALTSQKHIKSKSLPQLSEADSSFFKKLDRIGTVFSNTTIYSSPSRADL